jgi:predicted ferric reductase
MRGFIVFVLFLAVGIGITGFALGWFTVDQEKMNKDRDAALALFHSSRDTFQKQAETRLNGMDKDLEGLKAKAKTASVDTKVDLDQTISDLGDKTRAARAELKELGAATQENYDSLKTHLDVALKDLKSGFEKAISRF